MRLKHFGEFILLTFLGSTLLDIDMALRHMEQITWGWVTFVAVLVILYIYSREKGF